MYIAKQGFLCGTRWIPKGKPLPDDVDEERIKTLIKDGAVEASDRPESADMPPAPETADMPPAKPQRLSTATGSGVIKKSRK